MARLTKHIIADLGKYVGADGEEKTRWQKCGVMFDNGGIKIDLLPLTPEWSGWMKAVDPTPREEHPQRHRPQQHRAHTIRSDEDLPF